MKYGLQIPKRTGIELFGIQPKQAVKRYRFKPYYQQISALPGETDNHLFKRPCTEPTGFESGSCLIILQLYFIFRLGQEC